MSISTQLHSAFNKGFKAIKGISAYCCAFAMSMIYVNVLMMLGLPIPLVFLTACLSAVCLYQVYSPKGEQTFVDFSRLNGWGKLQLGLGVLASLIAAICMYSEFLSALQFGASVGGVFAATYLGLTSVIAVLSCVSYMGLMIKNAYDLILNLQEGGASLLQFGCICAFYTIVVTLSLHAVGLFPYAISGALIGVLSLTAVSAFFIMNRSYLSAHYEQFIGHAKQSLLYLPLAALIFFIRIIERVALFFVTSLHFVAESLLPAAGLLKMNRVLFGLSAKVQAVFLINALTLSEALQDFKSVVGVMASKEKRVNELGSHAKLVYVLLAVSCAATLLMPLSYCAAFFLLARFGALNIFFADIREKDVTGLKNFVNELRDALSFKGIMILVVTGLAGFCSAYEIAGLYSLSLFACGVFAISGMVVERAVYREAIDNYEEEAALHKRAAHSAKATTGVEQKDGLVIADRAGNPKTPAITSNIINTVLCL